MAYKVIDLRNNTEVIKYAKSERYLFWMWYHVYQESCKTGGMRYDKDEQMYIITIVR